MTVREIEQNFCLFTIRSETESVVIGKLTVLIIDIDSMVRFDETCPIDRDDC